MAVRSMTLALTFLLAAVPVCMTYRVLLICPSIRSQIIINQQLARALVSRGNDVTMVKSASLKLPNDLLQDPRITIETYQNKETLFDQDPEVQKGIMQQQFNFSVITFFKALATASSKANNEAWDLYNDKALMERLAKAKFDFAVLSPPMITAYSYIPYHLDIPFAYMGVECVFSWMMVPSMSPNYVPNPILSGYSDRMSLFQKVVNTMAYLAMTVGQSFTPGPSEVHRAVPNRPAVAFSEIQRSASLCLRIRENVVDSPRPNLPNVIDVGNMILREVEPLPENLLEFLDNSPEGALLVSFGSVVDKVPDYFIARMAEGLIKSGYRIIWKRKVAPKIDLPEDKFLVVPWTPQVDVLNHRNTKAFVSHCGFSSTFEAVYQGVPLVCLPFMGDQDYNAHFMEMKGYAKRIAPVDMTPENLLSAIQAVIAGPAAANMMKASEIINDLPDGGEKAVYWIEHVIKHGDTHLRSSMLDMPVWEYLMIDVIGVVLLFVTCISLAMCWLCKMCCRKCGCRCCSCCKRKQSKKRGKQD